MASAVKGGCDYKRLLGCLVRLDLRSKYVGSVMGVLWTVAGPLFMLLVYTFVFSVVFRVEVPPQERTRHYAIFLFAGLLPWHAFQRGLMRSTTSLVENAGLIKKIAFPVNIIPVYLSISDLLSDLAGFALLVAAIAFFGPPLHAALLLLPVLMALQLLFTIGLGWIAACLNAYFRDVAQVAGLGLLAWFFATPVIYPLSRVPDQAETALMANPMTHLIEMYRAVLLRGEFPSPLNAALFSAAAAAAFVGGYALFKRNEKLFADLI